MTTMDANAFLMGGDKVPSASFLTKGTEHEGEVLDVKLVQQTDPDTREPMHWKNGDPIMQVRVTIQTEERDDEIEEDDGRRRFYLKFKMLDAVRQAVAESLKAAGLPPKTGIEIGGWLGVAFVRQDKAQSRVKSGIKHFEAWYEPPTEAQRNAAKTAEANEAMLADDNYGDEGSEAEPKSETRRRQRGRAAASEDKPAKGRGRKAAEPDEPDDSVGDDAEGDTDDAEEAPKRGRGRASSAAAKPARGRGRRAASDDDESF